jgi:hypothetical protein
MALQGAAQFAESIQFFLGKIPRLGEHGVQQWRGVSLTQDESVSLRPVWFLGIVAEEAAEVQGDGNLNRGKGTSGVARAGFCGAGNDGSTNAFRALL